MMTALAWLAHGLAVAFVLSLLYVPPVSSFVAVLFVAAAVVAGIAKSN